MTNFEYFKDDILKMCEDKERLLAVQNDRPVYCAGLACARCDFFGKLGSCKTNLVQWLYSEHEESEVDWSSVEVDTKILVSNNGEKWHRRYFACYDKDSGKVYAWNKGATSWSNEWYDIYSWAYAKLDDGENYDPNCTLREVPIEEKPKTGRFPWGK